MLIKVRWQSLSWVIVVFSLFLMNFNLLNNFSLGQFVSISAKYEAPRTSEVLSPHLEVYQQLYCTPTVCGGNDVFLSCHLYLLDQEWPTCGPFSLMLRPSTLALSYASVRPFLWYCLALFLPHGSVPVEIMWAC